MKIYKSEQLRQQVYASYDQVLATWGVATTAHFVPTKYGLTHCLTTGNSSNPPLVLLHGIGDNAAVMWALNMKSLSERYYCIAIDTIGGPGKSEPNEQYRKGKFQQTEWLTEVIDHFTTKAVHLVGVSNGAYMAYHYTTVYSNRVQKAVCLEGGIVTNPLRTMFATLMLMFPEVMMPTERNMHRIIRKLASPHTNVYDNHPLLAQHLVLLMKSHQRQAMFPHEVKKYDPISGSNVKDKLYFLVGDEYKIVTKKTVELMQANHFYYKIIDRAGHGINHEQPEIVDQEILQFLNR